LKAAAVVSHGTHRLSQKAKEQGSRFYQASVTTAASTAEGIKRLAQGEPLQVMSHNSQHTCVEHIRNSFRMAHTVGSCVQSQGVIFAPALAAVGLHHTSISLCALSCNLCVLGQHLQESEAVMQ
jgi:hypothetical protein